tara:strand:- start:3926 stop:4312 length:387 start_codon:yes stop_codon:yes gene_type:complete
MKKRKGIDNQLDVAWSRLVKLKAGLKCEIENCTHKPTLNSHHIFSRRSASTRWDLDNGLCLCVGHHTMSSKFSAHGNPIAFTYWLEEYKSSDWIDELSFKAHSTKKWHKHEKAELLQELKNQIKNYEI